MDNMRSKPGSMPAHIQELQPFDGALAAAFALLFALWLLYASVLESSRLQATLGKLAMFIRVVDDEGSRTTLLRAFARNALKLISALPLCIGYLMSGWTPRKQALHDILG